LRPAPKGYAAVQFAGLYRALLDREPLYRDGGLVAGGEINGGVFDNNGVIILERFGDKFDPFIPRNGRFGHYLTLRLTACVDKMWVM
jgi:hypothetical protein